MRLQRLFLILVATMFLSASQVQAGDYSRAGVYAGVNAAYGIDLFGSELRGAIAGPGVSQLSMGNSWGLNARLGGRLLSFLAVEAQYEWMQNIAVNWGGLHVADFKPHTVTGNVKLIIPISRFEPYILAGVGVGIWKLESDNPIVNFLVPGLNQSTTGLAGRVGAGIDIYLTEHIALNAEGAGVLNTNTLTVAGESLSGLYYFSVSGGLLYRF